MPDSFMRIRVLASMRFHARSMNAYLYASQLGHIPEQLAWAAAKQGMAAHTVGAAYSSQECPRCHDVDRANRRTQQTFKCVVCGYEDHADHKAAVTLAGRWGIGNWRLAATKGRARRSFWSDMKCGSSNRGSSLLTLLPS